MKKETIPQPAPENQTAPSASPSTDCCASSLRYTAMKKEQTLRRLAENPHHQAEAIASHYSRLAQVAMDLREMLEMRKYASAPMPEMESAIKSITEKIAEHHLNDFGIELSWHNVIGEASPPCTPKIDQTASSASPPPPCSPSSD